MLLRNTVLKQFKFLPLILLLCCSPDKEKIEESGATNNEQNIESLIVGNWELVSYSIENGVKVFNNGDQSAEVDFVEIGKNFNFNQSFIQGGLIECDGFYDVVRNYIDSENDEIAFSDEWRFHCDDLGQEGFLNYTWRLDGNLLYTLFDEPGTTYEYPATIEDISENSLLITIDLKNQFMSDEEGIINMEFKKIP